MALTTAGADIRELRRELVASFLLRKMTQREIVEALAEEAQLVNPETGAPFDLATIHRDIKWLRAQWRKEAAQSIKAHQAQLFAELEEIKRAAWTQGDYEAVRRVIGQQWQMVSESKVSVAVGGSGGAPSGGASIQFNIMPYAGQPATDSEGEEED